MIIVEAIIDLRNNPGGAELPDAAQVLVNDANVMYDFHFYKPEDYVSQKPGQLTGAVYQDSNEVELPPDLVYVTETPRQPSVAENTTGWLEYAGPLYKVQNADIVGGYVFLESNDNSGKVYFDDATVNHYDENGTFVRTIEVLDFIDTDDWENYSSGSMAIFAVETTTGHDNATSFSIANHSGAAAWFTDNYFSVITGHHYQVSGWMKGEAVAAGATAQFKLGFSRSNSGLPPLRRTKAYLEYPVDQWLAFGETNNVPLQVGEFGIGPATVGTVGGEIWLADMFDILNARGVCYSFWSYHDDGGGIYTDLGVLPNPVDADQAIIDVIRAALAAE